MKTIRHFIAALILSLPAAALADIGGPVGSFVPLGSTQKVGSYNMSSGTVRDFTASTVTVQAIMPSGLSVNVPAFKNAAGVLASRAVRLDSPDVTGTLPTDLGGTGHELYGDGVLLVGNSSTGRLSTATITAGSNITVTNGNGSITLSATGGGSSSSMQTTAFGVPVTSPTLSMNFGPAFTLAAIGSTTTVAANVSSVTLQGNTYSISGIAVDTGTLTTRIISVGVSTAAIAADTGTFLTRITSVGVSTAAIAADTGTLRTSLTTVATDTTSLRTTLNSVATSTATIATSTASLQTQVNTLSVSTATIAVDTGTLTTRIVSVGVSTAAIAIDTGTLTTRTVSVGVSTAAIAVDTGTFLTKSSATLTYCNANGTNCTASGSSGGYALEPATKTINAAQGITISSAITYSIPSTVVSGTFTIPSSSMSVILVSVPANTAWVTQTLPSASTYSGSDIMFYKVDGTTGSVRIVGAGTDVIEGSGTLRLDAKIQHASLHSLGAYGWGAGTGGIQYTPSYLGYPDGRDTATVGTSSNVFICPIDVSVPVTVTGYRFYNASGSGNIVLGLYDQYGNLLTSTGPVSAGSFGPNSVLMATPYNLPPGQYYYALQASNTSLNFGATNVNGGNGSLLCSAKTSATIGLPNPYVFPGVSFTRIFTIKVLVNGGRTSE